MKHSYNNGLLSGLASVDQSCGGDVMRLIYPQSNDRAELLIAVRPGDYSAAAIARAVEDCDVHLVNLNLTSARTDGGDLIVAVRVDCTSPDAVARSLERYGYSVIDASGAGSSVDDEVVAQRAAELMHILEL